MSQNMVFQKKNKEIEIASGIKTKAGEVSLAPILGVKFNENFGLEAGFNSSTKINDQEASIRSSLQKLIVCT